MSHTPGPWGVVMPGEVDEHYAVMDSFGHTASVYGYPENAAEAWANAQLMAAAPELLAVCQAIANDLSLFQFTDGEYRLSEQSASVILQSLREVIAKAEGKSE